MTTNLFWALFRLAIISMGSHAAAIWIMTGFADLPLRSAVMAAFPLALAINAGCIWFGFVMEAAAKRLVERIEGR